jgi:hypothetical protein
MPGWVEVGRIILGRQADRLMHKKIEEGTNRHAVRQAGKLKGRLRWGCIRRHGGRGRN